MFDFGLHGSRKSRFNTALLSFTIGGKWHTDLLCRGM